MGTTSAVGVVMRVTTLEAAGDRLGGLLAYYAGLAEDRSKPLGRGPVDYYLDPSEPAGRWHGRGRAALGLDGDVAAEGLRALLEGRHPTTGRPLGRRFGDTSARGFDATFSAPKSVSALWALTPDPWVRAEVLAAHDTAVVAALDWLEEHGAVTRRGKDGVHQVDTQGLTVAVFRQHTSRTADPQLHSHAVIAAKVQDATGRWLSLDARFLKQQQRTIGWIYDAALRAELTARLGLAWGPIEGGQADATCIPEPVRHLFSQRSVQVEAKLADLLQAWSVEHDGADPDPLTIGQLKRRAVLASRPAKLHGLDAADLHRTWRHQTDAIGFAVRDLAYTPSAPRPRFAVCRTRTSSPRRSVECRRSHRPGFGPTSPATWPPSWTRTTAPPRRWLTGSTGWPPPPKHAASRSARSPTQPCRGGGTVAR